MRDDITIGVIIPALDEEAAIALVIDAIPPWVDHIVVVDNGCRDATATTARAREVVVAEKPRRGYGAACQCGIRALPEVDVVVFLDADYSDFPEQMDRLVDPLITLEANLVIGVRTE